MAGEAGNLGRLIRRYRVRAELSQADLAARMGVSLRTIGNWERQGAVPNTAIDALGDVLGGRFDRLSATEWAFVSRSDDIEGGGGTTADSGDAVVDFGDELLGVPPQQHSRVIAAARLAALREADAVRGEGQTRR